MGGSSRVLLEPTLVGAQHGAILQALVDRFGRDPVTGRWVLRPGQGGLVVLSGHSGTGKSRLVRELYRALRAGQSQPGYWPELAPSGGAAATKAGPSELKVFGFRKYLGPDAGGMLWPPRSVPDYLWWHLTCQANASMTGYVDTMALFAHQLLAHQEPAQHGWARAKGPKRWATRAARLLDPARRAVADEAVSEYTAYVLGQVAGHAVPFGGLVTQSLRGIVGAAGEAGDRRQRLDNDTLLGIATGGVADPTDTLAAVINSLALPSFPVIVAVEDIHEADPGLLNLLRRLTGPAYTDRILIVATAWPEALASRHIGSTPLDEWLTDLGADFHPVQPLTVEAATELVLEEFPGTAPDRVAAVATRWTNPLAINLVLDILVRNGRVTGNAITASDTVIATIPPTLAGLYDAQFQLLPEPTCRALILDVVCGADPATAAEYDRSPGKEATWSAVEPNWVTVAAGRAEVDPAGLDHDTAVKVGWLLADTGWVVPREPGLAAAAWRAIPTHGLQGAAPEVRAQAARVLAEAINITAQHADGAPGLFLGTDRSWTREAQWMVLLAHDQHNDPEVQAAATRAAFELFQHRARIRPQEALRDWATWAPRWEALLGPDHPDTLTMQNSLASAYQLAGDLNQAIRLFQQTLADRERILGLDHPHTLASRSNLAGAYLSAEDLSSATPLCEQAVDDYRRILGPDHPDTLTSSNNLACAYLSAGDVTRATPLFETTVSARQQILGPDHPYTVTTRSNLARAYLKAGALGQATHAFEQTLAHAERVLGPDHPDTLNVRDGLATAAGEGRDLGRAITLNEQNLRARERVLGADHPDTLVSRDNLAGAYESAGDLGRATPLYQLTLADRERILGPDHPHTLTSVNNLAYALRQAGNLEQAILLYKRVLGDAERLLGATHPDTLTTRNNLACAYQAAQRLDLAIDLFRRNLALTSTTLGHNHTDTFHCRNALASALQQAGHLDSAIPLFETTLTEREQLLGPDHPHTLVSRNNLAYAHQCAGNLDRAARLHEQTLRTRLRIFGPEHPDTQTSHRSLMQVRAMAAAATAFDAVPPGPLPPEPGPASPPG